MISEKLFEIVLVVIVAIIILTYGVAEIRDFGKEITLKANLQKYRTAIKMYYSRCCTYPASLELAAEKGHGKNVSLIIYNDRDGRICDPFGRRYHYDPETGKLHSRTPGCENY